MSTFDSSALCTVDDVKFSLELTTSDYDALIQILVTAASYAIQRRCQREFLPRSTAVTRRFPVRTSRINLAPYDLVNVTSVTFDPTGTGTQVLAAGTDYTLEPVQGALGSPTDGSQPVWLELVISRLVSLNTQNSRNFGYSLVDITGDWGAFTSLATVPPDLRRAAVICASSWLDRSVTAYAIHDQMDARDIRPDQMSTWAIPSAAYRALEPYMRLVF
jgi:hypothetical protein